MAGRGARSKQNKAAKAPSRPAARPASQPSQSPDPPQPVAPPSQAAVKPEMRPPITQPEPPPEVEPEPLQPTAQPSPQPEPLQPTAQPSPQPEPLQPTAQPSPQPEPLQPTAQPSPQPEPSAPLWPRPSLASLGHRRRDPRRWIYAGLDLLFAAVYAVVISIVIPNRLPSATLHLWTFPAASLAMAVGMLAGSRPGWWIAVLGGSLSLLSMALLIVRIAISAAFLAGVYGTFGKAAAMFALVMIALVIELVALLPIVQVKYLMTRAGRRALGHAPP